MALRSVTRPSCVRSALLLGGLAAACTKYQDMDRIRASLRVEVKQQTGADVLWVDCPSKRAARPRDRFECRVGIEGGALTAELVQDEYANVQWTLRELVVDMRKLEATIRGSLRQGFAVDVAVTCPGRHRPSIPGSLVECEAAFPKGRRLVIPVVVKDTRAQVDWSVTPESVRAAAQ